MIPILIGAIGAVIGTIGTIAILANWDELVSFFKDLVSTIKNAIKKAKEKAASAATMTACLLKNGYVKIMHNLYYRKNNKWMEETTAREVTEDEVPDSIKRQLTERETDITKEMSRELQMEIC